MPHGNKTAIMRLLIICFCLILSGMFTHSQATELAQTTTSFSTSTTFDNLSLDACIDIALEHNLDMRIAHENVKIAESSYRVNKGVTTPDSSLSGSNSRTTKSNEADSATLSVSKYFTTGATLSASAGSSRAADTSNENYTSSASISLTQPLLKGRGGTSVEATELGLKILDEEIEITRSLQDTKRNLIHTVTSAYYRLIGAQRNIITAQESVNEAERVLKVAKIKKEEGLVAKIDVSRSEVQLASQQASLVSAKRGYESALESFVELMGLELGTQLSVESTVSYVECAVKLEDYIELAFQNRLDWKSAQLNFDRSDISLRIARLNKLPQLDAGLSYGASKTTSSLEDSWKFNSPELVASLTWSIPLWQTHTDLKESYLQAVSSKKISEINLDNTRRGIILEVRQAVIAVEEAKENLNILEASIKQAEESLRLAKRSYEEGLQTYLDVLNAQQSYTSTQNSYTSALINYLVALSNLDRVVASHPKLQG